jgi:hypothetical protein
MQRYRTLTAVAVDRVVDGAAPINAGDGRVRPSFSAACFQGVRIRWPVLASTCRKVRMMSRMNFAVRQIIAASALAWMLSGQAASVSALRERLADRHAVSSQPDSLVLLASTHVVRGAAWRSDPHQRFDVTETCAADRPADVGCRALARWPIPRLDQVQPHRNLLGTQGMPELPDQGSRIEMIPQGGQAQLSSHSPSASSRRSHKFQPMDRSRASASKQDNVICAPASFTETQAESSKQKFEDQCACCQGSTLAGRAGPALKGPHFVPARPDFHVGDIFGIVSKKHADHRGGQPAEGGLRGDHGLYPAAKWLPGGQRRTNFRGGEAVQGEVDPT